METTVARRNATGRRQRPLRRADEELPVGAQARVDVEAGGGIESPLSPPFNDMMTETHSEKIDHPARLNVEIGDDSLTPVGSAKKSGFMSGNEFRDPYCVCLLGLCFCGTCIASIVVGPFYVVYIAATKCWEWHSGNALFDNVLADTENAFQTLAKALVGISHLVVREWSLCGYMLMGWWLEIVGDFFSFCFVLLWTVLLILPSFFTLLILRATSIESQSTAFGGTHTLIIATANDLLISHLTCLG